MTMSSDFQISQPRSSHIKISLRKILLPVTIVSLVGAAGLYLFGSMLPAAIKEYKTDRHLLSVKGLFEEVVQSDRAYMEFTLTVAGNQLKPLYEEAAQHTQRLRTYLIQQGIEAQEISTDVPRLTDNKASRPTRYAGGDFPMTGASLGGPAPESSSERSQDAAPSRYFLEITVRTKTPKIHLCQEIIQNSGAFLELGIPIVGSNVFYEYSKFGENRIAMLDKAFANAQDAAHSFARVTGSSLGGIRRADQGHFSIESLEGYRSSIDKKIRVVVHVDYFIKTGKDAKRKKRGCAHHWE